MSTEIFLLGAGGHGKVVLDAMSSVLQSVKVFDQNPDLLGKYLLKHPINIFSAATLSEGLFFHVAIGDNLTRRHQIENIINASRDLVSVIHPTAVIAMDVDQGEGLFVGANSVIGPGSEICLGAILNHNSVVDHDCKVSSFCHIGPGATLGGGVVVGENVLVGAGAVVLPGLRIGRDARVGAGAVVTRNVLAGTTVVGIPAKTSR